MPTLRHRLERVALAACIALPLFGCFREFDRSLIGQPQSGDSPIVALDAADISNCAVHRDGRMWCWGGNGSGQLGDPEAGLTSRMPVLLPGAWASVATSSSSACALDRGAALYCWGRGGDGQLGLGSTLSADVPTRVGTLQDWSGVTVGKAASCGIRGEGELYCWGWSVSGQLGFVPPGSNALEPTRVSIPRPVRAGSLGDRHGCAIDVDDRLWCWGSNGPEEAVDGRRGYTEGLSVPPQQVQPEERYRQVSAGATHTCGIRDDGTLWCWGDNTSSQLGGDSPGGIQPVRVQEPSAWRTVSAGDQYTCGVSAERLLYCWGNGASGKLGLGDELTVDRPTQVGSRADWTHVAAGGVHTCGATQDGMLHCWGSPSHGANGQGGPTFTPAFVLYE